MFYTIETVKQEDYSSERIRTLLINGLKQSFNHSQAALVKQMEEDEKFYKNYMGPEMMLLVLKNGETDEDAAFILLNIVPLADRTSVPLDIPGGFAYIVGAYADTSKLKDMNAQEALSIILTQVESNLEIVSETMEKEGFGTINSIAMFADPDDPLLFDWAVSEQFMSYENIFTLPYLCQGSEYLHEFHPVEVNRFVDASVIKHAYMNFSKEDAEAMANTSKAEQMMFLTFPEDDFEALITVPRDGMLFGNNHVIHVDMLLRSRYDSDQEKDNGAPDFVPRTVSNLELIGEYICHRYGYTQLVILFKGSDDDIDVIGREYLASVLFVRNLSSYLNSLRQKYFGISGVTD